MAGNDPRVLLCVRTHEMDSDICCSLIGQQNTKVFWTQSGARTGLTIRNCCGETYSQELLVLPLAFLCPLFFSLFQLSLASLSAPGSPRMDKPKWLS